MKKRAKQIHLTEGAIKALSIQAINKGTNFKLYVQDCLEKQAIEERITKLQKAKG